MSEAKNLVECNPSAVYTLSEEEKEEVLALAKQLSGSGEQFVNDPAFLKLAVEKSAWLPRRILAVLRKFKNDPLSSGGYLMFRNMPIVGDAPLPDTPTEMDVGDPKASVSASALALMSVSLGEIVAHAAEKKGALVQNVMPLAGWEETHSYAASGLLELHTENVYHEHFPDYVNLLCLREDLTGVGKFCVSAVRDALPLLSPDTIQVLTEPRFETKPPMTFESVDNVRYHTILSGVLEDPNITVDFALTTALDDRAASALDELRDAFMKTLHYYRLRVGDLVIVDNRVVVHGRTSFVPRYDGTDRWLQRIYTIMDNRRTRAARKNNGNVLD